METLNPQALNLNRNGSVPPFKSNPDQGLPTHFPDEKFLKGPIPLSWLNKAGSLPGKALHVGIGIWHLAGLEKCRTVALSQKVLRGLGVQRNAAYRSLQALEKAGLVIVQRHPGRNSTVTINWPLCETPN